MSTADQPTQQIAAHHDRLVGWFRARVFDRDLAEELTQRTWSEVLRRIDSFNPEQGSFFTFTKIWAEFVLRRHRSEMAKRRKAEISISTESDDATGLENEISLSCAPRGIAIDDCLDRGRVFLSLLSLALGCRRLPHEIVAFGFVKLLDWKPARVVHDLSGATLEEAAAFLEREYAREAPSADVERAFAKLRSRLTLTLAECETDPRAKKPFSHLLDRKTGGTILSAYYRDDATPEMAVVRWWSAVTRAVAEDLVALQEGPLAEWISDFCTAWTTKTTSRKR